MVYLAQLAGSCTVQCIHSVWTCRTVINLPVSHPFSQEVIERMKGLGILDKPTLSDAILNLPVPDYRFLDLIRNPSLEWLNAVVNFLR